MRRTGAVFSRGHEQVYYHCVQRPTGPDVMSFVARLRDKLPDGATAEQVAFSCFLSPCLSRYA